MPPALVVRFADETDIFGLHLFKIHRSRFEIVFWLSFVLIFSCYTTKTLVSIVKSYMDEEFVSYVYQKTDANISFPFAELCIFSGEPTVVVKHLPVELAIESVLDTVENRSKELNGSAFVTVMDFLFQLQLSEWKLRLPRKGAADDDVMLRPRDQNIFLAGLRAFEKRSKTTLANLSEFLLLEL